MHSKLPLMMAALGLSALHADVTLPALISDHAVLQKSARTGVWGLASPGENVTVILGAAKGEASAGPDGKWRVELDLTQVGAGPLDLSVTGKNQITVKDVVVGEVWVASGQSNMEWPLKTTLGAGEEIEASANPLVRHFGLTKNASSKLEDSCTGTWMVAGPASSGSFTAAGYYFSKRLQQTLQVPVGVIQTYWGGSPIEAWTSLEAMTTQPDLKESIERIAKQNAEFDSSKQAYVTAHQEWTRKYAREDRTGDPIPFADPKAVTTDWKKVTLPGKLSDAGLPDAGVVWLRKVVVLDEAQAKTAQTMQWASPTGFETVYYNGKQIYAMSPDKFRGTGMRRERSTNTGIAGENVIAIRLYSPGGNSGISTEGFGGFKLGPVGLKGEWLAKAEYEFPSLPPEAKASYPQPPKAILEPHNQPALLFQGMINPVIPYTMQGVIWYQGENNIGRAYRYQTAFPLMIQDWRKKWGRDFPFYFCQLANFKPRQTEPGDSSLAELREAQDKALTLPNTGQAVLLDLGESDDVHFWNKKDVGERLALIALGKTYGKDVVYSGPVYESFKVEENKIRITFKKPTGGLVARPLPATYLASTVKKQTLPLTRNSPESELEGFMVCGTDKKWVWADAKIDGESVLLSSSKVPTPVAARYAWADNPIVNLYNQSGLPAAPFKTDDFPWTTKNGQY